METFFFFMLETITQQLQDRVTSFEFQVEKLKNPLLEIADTGARELILGLIEKSKLQGKKEFDAFDIQEELHLPFAQISTIMQELEKQGIVHEKV